MVIGIIVTLTDAVIILLIAISVNFVYYRFQVLLVAILVAIAIITVQREVNEFFSDFVGYFVFLYTGIRVFIFIYIT